MFVRLFGLQECGRRRPPPTRWTLLCLSLCLTRLHSDHRQRRLCARLNPMAADHFDLQEATSSLDKHSRLESDSKVLFVLRLRQSPLFEHERIKRKTLQTKLNSQFNDAHDTEPMLVIRSDWTDSLSLSLLLSHSPRPNQNRSLIAFRFRLTVGSSAPFKTKRPQ
jgi:hypothetical protein